MHERRVLKKINVLKSTILCARLNNWVVLYKINTQNWQKLVQNLLRLVRVLLTKDHSYQWSSSQKYYTHFLCLEKTIGDLNTNFLFISECLDYNNSFNGTTLWFTKPSSTSLSNFSPIENHQNKSIFKKLRDDAQSIC